jgi:carbon-monoxide dehydrogenase small subunit
MASRAGSIALVVNGSDVVLDPARDFHPSDTLAAVLRDRLGFTGLKVACDQGACGACTVLLDGRAVLSCMMLALEADGHEVLTIEGLPADDPVIVAFAEQCEPGYGTAMQCGFCTPGFVMAATGLLNENPDPTLDEVKEALAGNICRCGCYPAIARAVLKAAAKMKNRATPLVAPGKPVGAAKGAGNA